MFFRHFVCVGMIVTGLSIAPLCAHADEVRFDINIETTDAAAALNMLSRQTNYPLLFNYEDVKPLRVNSLNGQYTLSEAMKLMFQDTGFTGHLVNREVLTVSPLESSKTQIEGKNMSIINNKGTKSLLGGASAVILTALAAPAVAQVDETDQSEMIVTGIRQSLQSALVEKRESDNLVEIIRAEDIGKLPDQNLAEVLENVTGIQITREAGVGTGVQIRGADENRIEINGVTTVGSGSGRSGIDFEDVAAAIIGSVEVTKAPESSTIEGAVGGTINLRTIRPLALDEDEPLANFRLQFEDSSLSTDGLSPRVDGTVGKKWSNAAGQEIGATLSISYTEQDTTAFRPRADGDNDQVVDANASNPGTTDFNFLPPQFFVQDLDNFEAENLNIAGSIEASPKEGLKLYFDAIVNQQERFQESSRIQASGISNSEVGLNVSNFTEFETVDFGSLNGQEIGTIERAVLGIVPAQADGTDGNLRFSSDTGSRVTDSEIFILGAEYELTNRLSGRVEFSDSSSDTTSPSFNTTLNFINPNVDLDAQQLRDNFFQNIINDELNAPNDAANELIEAQNEANAALNEANGNDLLPTDTPLLPTLPTNLFDSNENGTPFDFDLRNGSLAFGINQDPAFFGPTTEQLLNPANVLLRDVQQGFDEVSNSEEAFRADFNYDLEDTSFGNYITSIDAGYRYNETQSTFDDIGQNNGFRGIEQSPFGNLFAELLVPGPDNFDDADGRDLFVPNFLVIDPELTNSDPAAVLATLNAAILENNALFGFNGSTINSPTSNQNAFFDIEEETHAIYGQANFDFGLVRGNAGVRYVETDVTSTGNTTLNGVTTLTSTDGSYDFFLPRVNLIVEPIEDVVLRGAWSRDIRRPDFDDLSTSFTFSTSPNPAVGVGNPGLEPQEITNFDISAEWYFAPSAVFSIGYFRKERDGLFVQITEEPVTTVQTVNGVSVDVRDITDPCEGGGIFNPIADQNVFAPLDATGSQTSGVGVCVPLSQVINDPGTTDQQGIEVAFQYDLSSWEDRLGAWSWASGFGLQANYTWQDFSGTETVLTPTGRATDIFAGANPGATNVEFTTTLLNNSENAFNVTGYYEKFGLSARLRYTWRDEFRSDDFGSTNSFPFGFPVVQEARGQLNGSLNYDVTENFRLGVEAVNITTSDVVQRCVNADGPVCFQGLTDRRVIFGGSYTF